jgi:hypothetical protein
LEVEGRSGIEGRQAFEESGNAGQAIAREGVRARAKARELELACDTAELRLRRWKGKWLL